MKASLPCPSRSWLASLLLATALATQAADRPRHELALDGAWQFRRDAASETNAWKTVTVPAAFEAHEGPQFDGVGWYRKEVAPFTVPQGRRVLLHFDAAATAATVWWNGHELGRHLGGWTPFRFDITDWVRAAPPGAPHELRVRLDERVGHNTQGFLPVIAPHFGGLWQGVRVMIVPEVYVDDLRLHAFGDVAGRRLQLSVPLGGNTPADLSALRVRCFAPGAADPREAEISARRDGNVLHAELPVENPQLWEPSQPNVYTLELRLPGTEGDQVRVRAAFRTVEVRGAELLLNGRPLGVRGLLNWGYSAPQTDPNPGEATWREELSFARSYGFNLMKFCLWIPPKRYLELADELGMLTWMEYPTWHPQLTEKYGSELEREFTEFFHYDRNHPSVVLRSLTCETGSGAELAVIRRLYDLAHRMVPGSVVEDDSSWIGWNRVHDFYDDHPYGNNHTWVRTLEGLRAHIEKHGTKPLVLGEAIAADTWLDREAILPRVGSERPWWAPGPLDEQPRWLERVRKAWGSDGLATLGSDSLRYALLMRKYQIETYRREIPQGGYVISVIRDIPNATMGLLDYLGRPKWPAADWDWHGPTMCLLITANDCRSFSAGETFQAELWCSHFGPAPFAGAELTVELVPDTPGAEPVRRWIQRDLAQSPGTLARLSGVSEPLPNVTHATAFELRATLRAATLVARNRWPLWIVPRLANSIRTPVALHPSLAPAAAALFPQAPTLQSEATHAVVVASRFDDTLVRVLENGGRVLLLPDGQSNSFPLNAHWFLRGAPVVPGHPLLDVIPRRLLVELQHFDLAGDIIPNTEYMEAVDPLLMLWDTHDLKTVKTHGVIFETRAGRGRLLVSAARHTGDSNAAGRWLLDALLRHLETGPAPRHALADEAWAFLKLKLHAEKIPLVQRTWRFRPDPEDRGLERGWHRTVLADASGWNDIKIGAAWEGQGYPTLDRWAWYRLEVEIPARWEHRRVYLSFEGVDDVYELYVNGELAGRGGDLAKHVDAFNERKSHDITAQVVPGQKAVLAVRVHDWYGAGGIFRPVTLATVPFSPGLDLLK